jgi:DNA-binding CsgD family transcriptional regulator
VRFANGPLECGDAAQILARGSFQTFQHERGSNPDISTKQLVFPTILEEFGHDESCFPIRKGPHWSVGGGSMSKSGRLRLNDVRRLFHLLDETLQLGDDPTCWRRHFLAGLCQLIGDGRSGWLHIAVPSVPPAESDFAGPLPIWNAGWDDARERKAFLDSFDAISRDPSCNPVVKPSMIFLRAHPPLVTTFRRELVPDKDWYRSPFHDQFGVPSRSNDNFITSAAISPADRSLSALVVNRPADARSMGQRERKLIHLAHAEIAPLVGTRLATPGQISREGLTARQREVLDQLLAGRSEREIAQRLHRSPATIHEHILAIYHHFGVCSRAELMARWIRVAGRASAQEATAETRR